MKRLLASTLVALAGLGTALTWAQTSDATPAWKWRDASGRVTVSDTPPPQSVPDKDILVRPATQLRVRAPAAASAPDSGPKPTAVTPPGARVDPELEARRKKAADDQAAQQKAQEEKTAAARAENCGRAKTHLIALENGERLARTNARGEREVLDDKGRAEEMQRARAVIASDCK
jgi:cytoskeletal protein RodZ